MIQYLNFLHTTVRFDLADDAAAAFAPIQRFFRHLLADQGAHEPTFRIEVRGYDPSVDVAPEVWTLPQSVIRRSNAAEFNFDAHIVDRGGRRLYVNRATLLDAPVDARKVFAATSVSKTGDYAVFSDQSGAVYWGLVGAGEDAGIRY